MGDAMSIRLPAGLRKDLERHCRREHRAPSEVVREALRRHLMEAELRRLRERLRPYAEARGLVADEDFFKACS